MTTKLGAAAQQLALAKIMAHRTAPDAPDAECRTKFAEFMESQFEHIAHEEKATAAEIAEAKAECNEFFDEACARANEIN